MKKIIILTLFFCSVLSAQNIVNYQENDRIYGVQLISSSIRSVDKEAKGSPYIEEDFLPAKINNIKKTELVRFNAEKDVFEIMTEENKIMFLSKEDKYYIKLLDGSAIEYVNLPYNQDGENLNGYFVLIKQNSEKINLLKKQTVLYIKAKTDQTGLGNDFAAKYIRQKDEYFYQNKIDSSLINIPNSKKQFLKTFPSNEIKTFLNKEKINLNKEEDLIKIIQFYFK